MELVKNILEFIKENLEFFGIFSIVFCVVFVISTIVFLNMLIDNHRYKTCLEKFDNKKQCFEFVNGDSLSKNLSACRRAFYSEPDKLENCYDKTRALYDKN